MKNIQENPIYQYLDCIKKMEHLNFTDHQSVLPNDVNRMYFHLQMCQKIFGFDANKYQWRLARFREITDNLDVVCEIYSDSKEWELKNENDLIMMTHYLEDFFNKREVVLFINGGAKDIPGIRFLR